MESDTSTLAVLQCPVCGSGALDRSISSVDGVWQRPRSVSFCASCRAYFLDDMPSEDEIRRWYNTEGYAFNPASAQAKRLFREFRCRSQRSFIARFVETVECGVPPFRVLEVGCCEGRLLSLFAGCNVVGLEYSDAYRQYAASHFGIDLLPLNFEEVGGDYDLLIMSHVLEHFPDVDRVLAHAGDALRRKHGAFFIEVPNSPLPHEVDDDELRRYLATTHTFNFTARSLRALVERAGFRVVACERFTYRLPSGYSPERRAAVASVLLGEHGVGPATVLPTLRYIIESSVAMERSFEPLRLDAPYAGLGDNLRMIARLA